MLVFKIKIATLKTFFCVNEFALFAQRFYKYFGPKIYVLATDEIFKTFNFSFMPNHL